jgi:hypothetical protein
MSKSMTDNPFGRNRNGAEMSWALFAQHELDYDKFTAFSEKLVISQKKKKEFENACDAEFCLIRK